MMLQRFARNTVLACLVSLAVARADAPASADGVPVELKDIGITEHLGSALSVNNLKFLDETGKRVSLGDYFNHGRPVLLTMIYFECPNLCSFVLNGLVSSIKTMDWEPGKQFDVVAVSMDPREGPELAMRKKAAYIASYERAPESPESGAPKSAPHSSTELGWHFLTAVPELNVAAKRHGEPPANSSVSALAHELGFNYRWSEDQFAHSAATYVLTPEGKISRYLYGIDFPGATVRLALLEASSGKIGSIVDRVILFCYHYDPQTKKYSPYVMHLMQAGGGLTVLLLGLFLLVFWVRESRQSAASALPNKGV